MGGVSGGEEGGKDCTRKCDKGPDCKPCTQVGPEFNVLNIIPEKDNLRSLGDPWSQGSMALGEGRTCRSSARVRCPPLVKPSNLHCIDCQVGLSDESDGF